MNQKLLSLAVAAIMITNGVFAQFNYNFTVFQDTYQPLTGATSINDTTIWDEELYKVPIGFTFKIDTITLTEISILQSFVMSDTENKVTGFIVTDADLHDRGNAGIGTSVSPIRYKVDGTAGNRIFKLEIANAGFYDEWDLYSTNNDSIYAQVWLYEGSNIVELRYGPGNISNPSDYFTITGGSPVVAFVMGLDLSIADVDVAYYLSGSANSPTIDSTNDLLMMGGLNSYPANGTVYKFTPLPVSVKDMNVFANTIRVLGTPCTDKLVLSNNEKEVVTYDIIAVTGAAAAKSGELAYGRNNLDVSALAAGNYMLRLRNNKGAGVLRFTKM